MKKAVIFCGMPGSGKSIGALVANDLSIPVVVMGDVVREEATNRNLPHTPQTFGEVMIKLRDEFGSTVIADRCVRKIEQLKASQVVIDGARSEEEITTFQKAFEAITVVAVHAAPRVRFNRLLQRQRADDALTWEIFQDRDARELNVGLGRIIAKADVMFINEGHVDDLKEKVQRLLKSEFQLA